MRGERPHPAGQLVRGAVRVEPTLGGPDLLGVGRLRVVLLLDNIEGSRDEPVGFTPEGMLDRDVHDRLTPFGDEIVALDADLSSTIVAEEEDPGSRAEELRHRHEAAADLEERFRRGVADLFPASGGG